MSPQAAVRIGGAWVDCLTPISARVAGAWMDNAPPSGTTYERITYSTPASPDLVDGTQCYIMGTEFSLVVAKNCHGVSWRAPTTLATPNGTHGVAIWNTAGTRLAYKEFVPTAGVQNDIAFDADISLSSATTYIATVYTNHYVFTSGSPSGLKSPSNNVVAGAGRLASYNGGSAAAPYPSATFASTYHIGPYVVV